MVLNRDTATLFRIHHCSVQGVPDKGVQGIGAGLLQVLYVTQVLNTDVTPVQTIAQGRPHRSLRSTSCTMRALQPRLTRPSGASRSVSSVVARVILLCAAPSCQDRCSTTSSLHWQGLQASNRVRATPEPDTPCAEGAEHLTGAGARAFKKSGRPAGTSPHVPS